jgi:mycothiol synthase
MTTIEPAQPDDWTAALELALARTPAEQRPARVRHCLHLLEAGELDPRGIWIARHDQEIVGVQVCVPLGGAVCLFWLPSGADRDADALVQAGLAWCRSNRCKFAQAAVAAADWPRARSLLQQGFRHVTRMHLLRHDLGDLLDEPAGLRYEAYRPSLADTFAATLERTYEGTLDCPELNGKRTIAEILAGHRGQGTFHPECWWLVKDGAGPIGVLLLTEMSDGLTWDLMYLGVVPEARRRGHGRAMALHGLHSLCDQPVTHLTLSVDGRNGPARQLYEALGFIEMETNEVLLYFI